MKRRALAAALAGLAALPFAGLAAEAPPASLAEVEAAPAAAVDGTETGSAPVSRNGQDIFAEFLAGRADPGCDADASNPRWEQQFSKAPSRLANEDEDVLPLFGYVVDQLRAANLPTEFALIPFIESGYRPGARNGAGPAGLWQFVNTTARNHKVAVTRHYDGRLSAVESTAAAVRYLKTLYGMFGGDWRLALMAYNAGEARVLQAMRQAGVDAQAAEPAKLPGLSKTSYAYVEKLHALACVLDRAQTRGNLMTGLDREVPILEKYTLPAGTSLDGWAYRRALQPDLLDRLNPALDNAGRSNAPRPVLAPRVDPAALPPQPEPASGTTLASTDAAVDTPSAAPRAKTASQGKRGKAAARRTHTVRSGESAWSIAQRYHISVKTLMSRNRLRSDSVLKPGTVLALE